ncbi:MAG: class C sortase [Erysipelotrichaceae bacterium]|nr:class C sortase [Erysipelotrichaceae bacterium]
MNKIKMGKGKSKRSIIDVILILMFIGGLCLLIYPAFSDAWNTRRQQSLISDYTSEISDMESSGSVNYEEEKEKAIAYNEALLPMILPDSFSIAASSDEPGEEYMSCLNLTGDGVMGYVSIPKIDVEIPICHTTNDDVLQYYCGHLEGSSLPIGGESTHAVLAAHRGLPSAKLFTDLDLLELGDHFYIYVLDEVLCYEVDQILVVEPDETDSLAVEEGEDLVTLLTCTPYGVNTQRLLVRGHRVDYDADVLADEEANSSLGILNNYYFWIGFGLLVTIFVVSVIYLYYLKHGRKLDVKRIGRDKGS